MYNRYRRKNDGVVSNHHHQLTIICNTESFGFHKMIHRERSHSNDWCLDFVVLSSKVVLRRIHSYITPIIYILSLNSLECLLGFRSFPPSSTHGSRRFWNLLKFSKGYQRFPIPSLNRTHLSPSEILISCRPSLPNPV